jgi:hypothetical protein
MSTHQGRTSSPAPSRRTFVKGLAVGGVAASLGLLRDTAWAQPPGRVSPTVLTGTEFDLRIGETTVNITAAKGRPMLSWVGKRPLRHVTAFPAQHIEHFDPTGKLPDKGGLLFHGDNKEVLAHLLANGFRGEVNLISIDPPFDSGADYVRTVGTNSTV